MRGLIYDAAIRSLTKQWYAAVLGRLDRGAHLLDIGIGTGSALAANAALVRAKDVRVTGVDIDPDYIERAGKILGRVGLSERVEARLESVYDHVGGPYDAAYFSASFMLMPDPGACLRHVMGLLKPGGRVFFTQTFQERESKLMERVKPLLKKVTTIDFGTVTYEPEFRAAVEREGLELLELTTMSASVDGSRTYRIAVGRPRTMSAGAP